MRTSIISAPMLAVALVLAGCGKQAAAPADGTSAQLSDQKGAPSPVKHGNGIGTVTALDPNKGSVTLDHGAIAELGWPAMKMTFAAKPDQLAGVRAGDKVEFQIDWDGKTGSVTSMSKAQ